MGIKLSILAFVAMLKLVASDIAVIPERDLTNFPYKLQTIDLPRRHPRSLSNGNINLAVNANGKTINLNLQKRSSFLYGPSTPIVKLYKENRQSFTMAQQEKPAIYRRSVYGDPDHFASFTVDTLWDGSRIIKSANIGSANLTIFPASAQYLQSSDVLTDESYPSNQYIYRPTNNLMGQYYNALPYVIPYILPQQPPKVVDIPDTLYIEVLVIVDYELVKLVGQDNIINYLLTFWNQVDMTYQSLDNPKYKINIAGIALPQDSEVLEYFYKDPYTKFESPNFEFLDFLNNNGKWLYENNETFPFDSYDVAVTMTPRKQPSKWKGNKWVSYAGIANMNTVCNLNNYSNTRLNTAVALDDGNFGGVVVAAHEIGHLLGALHDDRYPCNDQDGFVMSTKASTNQNRFRWSQCSVNDLKSFLQNDPKCLYNVPKV